MEERHEIVLGMGELFDLPVTEPSKEAARERLDELADRLYPMTRPT